VKSQLELLRAEDWNVLIVLDACRADYFRRLCDPGAETVESPAGYTRAWFRTMREAGLLAGARYINANPIVTEETAPPNADGICVEHVLKGWGRHDTVLPEDVNAAVRAYLARAGQPERLVIHYMQPHAPAIAPWSKAAPLWDGPPPPRMCTYKGRFAPFWELADRFMMKDLGLQELVFSMEMHEPLPRCGPLKRWLGYAYAQLRRTARKFRLRGHPDSTPRTYAANLVAVWEKVQELLPELGGRIVITGDHGELLGEHGGLRGHNRIWRYPEVLQVPWLVVENGPYTARPIADAEVQDADRGNLRARLEALGYA